MGGLHHRRSLRLRGYDYALPGAYFVTVCAQNRACLFGEIVDSQMRSNGAGAIVAEACEAIPNGHAEVALDTFVVMPNHLHAIIVIGANVGAIHESPLQRSLPDRGITCRRRMLIPLVVDRLKMMSAKRINAARGTPGRPVWQRNYYERIIRDEDELYRIRLYIVENPRCWATDSENPAIRYRCAGSGDASANGAASGRAERSFSSTT